MHALPESVDAEGQVGAAPATTAGAAAGTYVTFDLSGQTLGVAVRHVREILDAVEISPLPNTPHDVEGVIDIRGESIAVIDMGGRLGMPRMETGEDTRIIVFELVREGALCPVGVLADRVRDVTLIAAEEIEAPPIVAGAAWRTRMVRGVARHSGLYILLLDLGGVFPDCGDVAADIPLV